MKGSLFSDVFKIFVLGEIPATPLGFIAGSMEGYFFRVVFFRWQGVSCIWGAGGPMAAMDSELLIFSTVPVFIFISCFKMAATR